MEIKNRSPDIKPFYRMPKELFTNPQYVKLSIEAKALFALVLDRASLSHKNNWIEEDKLYIILTIDTVAEFLNVGKDKAVKVIKELEKTCLISKKRQGRGKPNLIFPNPDFLVDKVQNSENQNSEKPNSRILNNRILEFGKTESNKNNISKTNINNQSIKDKLIEEKRDMVKKQIEYEYLMQTTANKAIVDLVVEIITEIYSSPEDASIIIQGRKLCVDAVAKRYRLLNEEHIIYVVDHYKSASKSKRIKNSKGYLRSCLYDAPMTMNVEYAAEIANYLGY